MLMTDGASEVTDLLAAVRAGDEAAVNQLIPAVYEELRRLAKRHMSGQRRGHTLQTADLVNEAYLKLVSLHETGWKDRIHFFAVASRAMRSVLVDYARRRGYAKRGGNPIRVSLSEADQISEGKSAEVIAVDEALSRLAAIDLRKSQIVELRYFGGLGVEEIAELMGVSSRTVKREWRWAKAWLYRELGEQSTQ
jgi:RNA polymerase sigma factor (TIGR02999 family)